MDNENKESLLPEEKAFPAEGMSETNAGRFQGRAILGEMPVAPPSQEEPEEDFFWGRNKEAPKSDLEAIEKGDV